MPNVKKVISQGTLRGKPSAHISFPDFSPRQDFTPSIPPHYGRRLELVKTWLAPQARRFARFLRFAALHKKRTKLRLPLAAIQQLKRNYLSYVFLTPVHLASYQSQ